LPFEKIRFTQNGKTITSASPDDEKKVWDATSGSLIDVSKTPPCEKLIIQSGDYDTTFFVRCGSNEMMPLAEVIEGIKNDLKQKAIGVKYIRPGSEGNRLLVFCSDSTVKVWNAISGKYLADLKGDYKQLNNARFTTDENKIVSSSEIIEEGDYRPDKNYNIHIWDAKTGEFFSNNNTFRSTIPIEFSRNGNQIFTYLDHQRREDSDAVQIWDVSTGQILHELHCRNDEGNHINISPDEKTFISISNNSDSVFGRNTLKKWDISSGKLIYTFNLLDSNDYFIQIPSGYYECSPNAAKLLHYVTPDLNVISFEQLDVKYNRPDKVLEAIGSSDIALINSYRNAYIKRINKLGINDIAFNDDNSVPEADFANRDNIKLEQTNENLELHIIASDKSYPLDRYNIWINEVPLFGQRGISIRNANTKNFDKTITIKLSQGDNKIETSVTNTNGIESYRMPLSVKYIPATTAAAKVYFIGIGINEFADNSHNLTWCVQDIRDLTKTMQSKYGSQFIVLDTFFNQNVTLSNIQSLKQKLLNSDINDKVIIAYSGHGLLSKDYDYYLSSYNVNFSRPEEEGIPYDAIENLFDSIPAREKILLLDACHSGEVDKEELQKINTSTAGLAKNNIKANPANKGVFIIDDDTGTGKLGLQNSFELMQNLFVNVGKGTGAIIISASGGVQFAQERSELGHGVFTYSVIEAMNNNEHMKVSDFKKYIGNRVLELTNGLQKPTTRNETIAVDWTVW
ncbi:MAG TPA: caspase family protein, partial [Panacibacter sp.]|nr:caspase family protein [Panacibacter sp.]